MTGRRIVSVSLPQFPMERWLSLAERQGSAPPDEMPLVLAVEGPHGPVVHAANRAAAQAGVRAGARVVDMQALCPALKIEPAEPGGDRAALERLAFWARRWCPWTVADGAEGLVLDTTGSDHLWGGEAAMLVEIETRLARLGLSARLAVAPTWGAAWALARFGPVRAICRDLSDLDPLPVASLRLGPETVLLLRRLGLKTIGSLAALPRLSLARRFSRAPLDENPLLRLDQATGGLAEPVAPPETPPVFRADARLAEPVFDPTHHLPALCDALCAQLAKAGRGARRIRLGVYRTDGEVRHIPAAIAAPTRDAAHMQALFRDRLDRLDPGFGFDLISLEATESEPLAARQSDLTGRPDAGLELAALIDRLVVRFGAQSLHRPVPRQSHIPERAETRAAPLGEAAAPVLPHTERPLSILDPAEEARVIYAVPEGPPLQFSWRRKTHRTVRFSGPERIAPEWWQDRPGTRLRDYFKVEDETGQRLWLYREGLHGDGRGGAPRWFVHGVFA
ncbi:MAG: DNA polymerase Y family protein [Rhodobacteraceae bacterium]|nr:DNA polymerase Y family protein [Paracoccaceae bacterium]